MRIKVKALTAPQRNTLSSKPVTTALPGFVVDTGPTWAILNGNPAECLTAIQGIMDGLREEGQGQGGTYKTLVSVRNKIEDAASKNAETSHVQFIANGVNISDVPPVLNGVSVVSSGEATAQVAEGKPKVSTRAQSVNLSSPYRNVQSARDNFLYQLRTAPSDAAREYWQARVDALAKVDA